MKLIDKLNVKYSSQILSNNIRLDVFEKENSPIILRISILCGDVFNSNKDKKGLAHFVEHVFLAGTKQFQSKDKIALYLDQFGGNFGGTTNHEKHWLDLKVASKEYVENLFIVLNQILNHSLISEKIIETERGSIVSEYKGRYSKVEQKVNKIFSEQIFNNTEYAIPVLGTLENIEKINHNDIKEFINLNLLGGKIGITIAGDISSEKAVEMCEKYLSFIPKSNIERISPELENPEKEDFITENQIKFFETKEDSSNIKIGFRTPGLYHKYHYEYFVINNILGARRGSVLNTILRYKLGLVYSVNSVFQTNKNCGYLSINTACKTENTLKVVVEVIKLIKNDIFKEITKERFELEKNRIVTVNQTLNESSSDWIEFGWAQTTTNEVKDFDFFIEQINNLKFENIELALKEMFLDKNIYIAYSNKANLDEQIKKLLD